jgi:hypothetical protein
VRATEEQIIKQLRAGHLPARVEASRQADGEFRSLLSYPEFSDILPARAGSKPADPAATPEQEKQNAGAGAPPRRWRILAGALAVGGAALLAGLLYWLLARG